MQMEAEDEAERQLLESIRAKKREKERREKQADREAFDMASVRLSGELVVSVIQQLIEDLYREQQDQAREEEDQAREEESLEMINLFVGTSVLQPQSQADPARVTQS